MAQSMPSLQVDTLTEDPITRSSTEVEDGKHITVCGLNCRSPTGLTSTRQGVYSTSCARMDTVSRKLNREMRER